MTKQNTPSSLWLSLSWLAPLAVFSLLMFFTVYFYQQALARQEALHQQHVEQEVNVLAAHLERAINNEVIKVENLSALLVGFSPIEQTRYTAVVSSLYEGELNQSDTAWILSGEIEQQAAVKQMLEQTDAPVALYESRFGERTDFEAGGEDLLVIAAGTGAFNAQKGRVLTIEDEIIDFVYPALNKAQLYVPPLTNQNVGNRDTAYIYIINPVELSNGLVGVLLVRKTVSSLFKSLSDLTFSSNYGLTIIDQANNSFSHPEKILRPASELQQTSQIRDFALNFDGQTWALKVRPTFESQHFDSLGNNMILTTGGFISLLFAWGVWSLIRKKISTEKALERTERLLEKANDTITAQGDELDNMHRQIQAAVSDAKNANYVKSVLFSNMSHEVRTPLNGILGMSELLKRSALSSTQMDYLKKLDVSAQHLAVVINDILDYSKIEEDKLQLEERPFSLYTLAEHIKGAMEMVLIAKDIKLYVEMEPGTSTDLIGDKTRIAQVISHLVTNAIKFTNEGEVRLTMSTTKGKPMPNGDIPVLLKLEVTDTGSGIERSLHDTIFEPFVQGNNVSRLEYSGSGLGLTLCRQLCRMMGGDVHFVSETGKGSQFFATMALKFNTHVVKQTSALNKQLDVKRVLILDDNPLSLEILSDAMAQMKAPYIALRNAKDAIELLKESDDIDRIILDWTMPEVDGEAFLKMLAELDLKHPPKVVVISAYDLSKIVMTEPAYPIAAILAKPCKEEDLFKALSDDDKANVAVMTEETIWQGVRIVICEDNKVNQIVIEKMLAELGVQVVVTNHGKECLHYINEHPPKDGERVLVIMDIQMPVMDGITATEKLRNMYTSSELPIVALTANIMPEDIEKYHAVGMNSHLGKPIKQEQLLSALRSLLIKLKQGFS